MVYFAYILSSSFLIYINSYVYTVYTSNTVIFSVQQNEFEYYVFHLFTYDIIYSKNDLLLAYVISSLVCIHAKVVHYIALVKVIGVLSSTYNVVNDVTI